MSTSAITSLLSRWRSDVTLGGNITAWETIPARQPRFEPFPADLHPALCEQLRANSIRALYSHQTQAWKQARTGANIALATDTASGKTLAYNLPVLDALLRDSNARALYLFPTKALAQDQLAGLRGLLAQTPQPDSPITPATYDGDTPQSARAAIRQKARLIISNPDMLHIGILPRHASWADFFTNLRFIVIDEMHIYRGVFGSHIANVIRRLKRIANFYGAQPQFILTSATIGNPRQLAEKLIEAPLTLLNEDGSGRGPKHFLIYNPPIVDEDLGLRASMLAESVRLAEDVYTYGIQTILFGRTRRTVEVMLRYLADRIGERTPQAIRAYRSGYLPAHRREIERGLRSGSVRTVVATTALELGIDLGGMGATIQAGYPGTIAGSWQQAGRAGRGLETSLSILVASPSPADQFLARHPDYFFGRNPERALIQADNLLILLHHLQCAAFELPFEPNESFGHADPAQVAEILNLLHQSGNLYQSSEKYFWLGDGYPSAEISLRSASAQSVHLLNTATEPPTTIGDVDGEAACWMVHPGAVYLHEGEPYLVETLDLEQHRALMQPTQVDYFTRPRNEIEVQLLALREARREEWGEKAHGELAVISTVSGYQMLRWESLEKLGFHELDLPPARLHTSGYWLSLEEDSVERLRAAGLWRNDPNNYGPEWPQQRAIALTRDKHTCRVCGTRSDMQSLHVHHKIPFRAFDTPWQANRLENLVTLCPACHQRAESAVRVRSGLAGLSYVLGQIAPLFLMCDTRDLGQHSDPKAAFAAGCPSVVIYEMIPAGIGFSQQLFERHDELLAAAREIIEQCICTDGCPSCVGPGGEAGSGGKAETLAILKELK